MRQNNLVLEQKKRLLPWGQDHEGRPNGSFKWVDLIVIRYTPSRKPNLGVVSNG